MEQIKIEAEARGKKPTPSMLRRSGMIPAILYGRQVAPVSLQVSEKEFDRALQQGARHGVIELSVVQGDDIHTEPVMLKEIQVDPLRGVVTHVDFHRISMEEKIRATVPVVLSGTDEVEDRGGIIQHQLREFEVECLPTDIPQRIIVDISSLGIGDNVSIKDVEFPTDVVPLQSPESIVLTIVAPRRIEEEVAEDEEAEAEGEEEQPGEAEEKE
jgi:large subunit ribosomal protein L25